MERHASFLDKNNIKHEIRHEGGYKILYLNGQPMIRQKINKSKLWLDALLIDAINHVHYIDLEIEERLK
jgi:hypothetical protein